MKRFSTLAIPDPDELIFGHAPHPLTTRRGVEIGAGAVWPELNFTLPTMAVSAETLPRIREMYAEIVRDACVRAIELHLPGFVVEFETVVEMTLDPQIGIDLTAMINDILEEYHRKEGLKTALRLTPNDLREMNRPPVMRSGEMLDKTLRLFEQGARHGADMLAIESTGGKEIHDEALMQCNLPQVIFALAIMGCRDMAFLWDRISAIAGRTSTIAAGDTACGFANTAMVLAEKQYIPRVFAAVVRAVSAVRSLVAYEHGAVGPGKDCGYENIILKAITGYPMSMEGRCAACAHLSPVGNVAAAACDLWSNESVQHIKLLGGMAPIVSMEQLIYDCRLMNHAIDTDRHRVLQRLFADSDAQHDPQALILTPVNAVRIARSITDAPDYYPAARAAALTAIDIMAEAHAGGALAVPEREAPWIDMMRETVGGLPDKEETFIESVMPALDASKFRAEEYGLA